MKKGLIIGLLLAVILVMPLSFAVPAAPGPICKISGKISGVSFIGGHLIKEGLCQRDIPTKYLLKVNINSISTISEDGSMNCTELYPLNSEQTLTILKWNDSFEKNHQTDEKISMEMVFKKNQQIKGEIHFAGDECDSGVYLENYQVIKEGFFSKIIAWFQRLFRLDEWAKRSVEATSPPFKGDEVLNENLTLQLKEQGYDCRYHEKIDFHANLNNCKQFYENCAEDAIVPAGWFCRMQKQGLTEDEKNYFEQNLSADCWYSSEPSKNPPNPKTGEISYIPKGWGCDIFYKRI